MIVKRNNEEDEEDDSFNVTPIVSFPSKDGVFYNYFKKGTLVAGKTKN